jgi:hypothetical protein
MWEKLLNKRLQRSFVHNFHGKKGWPGKRLDGSCIRRSDFFDHRIRIKFLSPFAEKQICSMTRQRFSENECVVGIYWHGCGPDRIIQCSLQVQPHLFHSKNRHEWKLPSSEKLGLLLKCTGKWLEDAQAIGSQERNLGHRNKC